MKGIDKVIQVLGEKIESLEIDLYLKNCEIEKLKKAAEIEKRPSTKKAEETR